MNENPEYSSDSLGTHANRHWFQFWSDFLLTTIVFYLLAGTPIPEVNEPHYWIKAAHYWNPVLGGGDIFLESGDVHWAFYLVFGYFTTFLPMSQAVAVGRWIIWILIAIGWTMLVREVFFPSRSRIAAPDRSPIQFGRISSWTPVATLAAPLWLAGLTWGNWAGEWVVGGAESKGIAYAFFFIGIACIMRAKWTLGWTSIGIGSVFHVVTGMWVIATVGLASMLIQLRWERVPVATWFRAHLLGWILCLAGFSAGALPAIQMDKTVGNDARSQAAVAQVYKRLSHHLSPTMFSNLRWRGLQAMLAVTAGAFLITAYAKWIPGRSPDGSRISEQNSQPTTLTKGTASDQAPHASPVQPPTKWSWLTQGNDAFRWLSVIALFAMVSAIAGLLIDLTVSPLAPGMAASILRFYWFRWNEVVWPMMLSITAIAVASGALQLHAYGATGVWRARNGVRIISGAALLYSVCLFWEMSEKNRNTIIPAGEKQSFSNRTDTPEQQRKQFDDWIAVCDWITSNIDDHELWLTPRRQQSFKWRTLKPELASWKDMPQNAAAVVLWNQRMEAAYVFDEYKQLQPWSESQILQLAADYSIKYALFDRRVMGQRLPKWEMLYPNENDPNGTFLVYVIPQDSKETAMTALEPSQTPENAPRLQNTTSP